MGEIGITMRKDETLPGLKFSRGDTKFCNSVSQLASVLATITVTKHDECSSLNELFSKRPIGIGTIESSGFVGIGVALSEEVSPWGGL